MTREFVLTHADTPASINAGGAGSRRHWGAAHREKRKWEGLYLMLLMAAKVPKGMEHCEAQATIRWKYRNRRDSTNYIAPIVKPLADVLAPPRGSNRPRWLPDDTDEFFSFRGPTFEYPEIWPYADPRVKSELVLRLTATYPSEPQRAAHGAQDG